MDSKLVSSTCKATVISLLIAMVGLLSPKVSAQEAVSNTDGTVQRLEDITIYNSTVQQLVEVGELTSTQSPWSVGGVIDENLANDTFIFNVNRQNYELDDYQGKRDDPRQPYDNPPKPPHYPAKYNIFGLDLSIRPNSEDWDRLNHGEGPRGYVAISFIRF